MKLWCNKTKWFGVGIELRPYWSHVGAIKSWNKSQVEPGKMPRLNLGPGRRPRLNLGNIPAISGKNKLGHFPAIAGKYRAIAGI